MSEDSVEAPRTEVSEKLIERLDRQFGEYSPKKVERQLEEWREPIRKVRERIVTLDELSPPEQLHYYLAAWAGPPSNGEAKKRLIELATGDAKEEAEKVQNFALWVLLHNKGEYGLIKRQGGYYLRLYRVSYYTDRKRVIETLTSEAFSFGSLTANRELGLRWLEPPAGVGGLWGNIVEVLVPIESVFTCFGAHPAFEVHRGEEEVLLNERGLEGAIVVGWVSGNGRTKPLSEEEKALLKEGIPTITFLDQVDISRL